MLSRQHEKATFISQITLGPDPHCLWLWRGLQRWCQQLLRNLGAETTALHSSQFPSAEVLICNMKEQSDSLHLELPEDKSLLYPEMKRCLLFSISISRASKTLFFFLLLIYHFSRVKIMYVPFPPGDQDISVVSEYISKMKVVYPAVEGRIKFSAGSHYQGSFPLVLLSFCAAILVLYQ